METTPLEELESYFKTENEHWNSFAYGLHCKAVEKGLFTDSKQPLQLVERAINNFEEYFESPAKAVELFSTQLAEKGLTIHQQLFIYKWIHNYLKVSEFEDKDLTPAKELLESYSKRLMKKNLPVEPLVKNIRETLKELIQKELEVLPETLKDLEPERRLNIVCKLIPYVLPKVETVHSTTGESDNWSF
ncbi:MAG: hypothetical protein WKF97_19465 [Chitinophagaceae bacterium]